MATANASSGSSESPVSGAAGTRQERSAGRERSGQESGRSDRELDCEPCGAGGSGRESEHEQVAEPKPKPKTPDVDLVR